MDGGADAGGGVLGGYRGEDFGGGGLGRGFQQIEEKSQGVFGAGGGQGEQQDWSRAGTSAFQL